MNNNLVKISFTLGIAGFIAMLAGCCCSTPVLILAVVLDIAAITVALISRQQTGNKLAKDARTAIILASISLVLSFGLAMMFSSIMSNTELLQQVEDYYKQLGYDIKLTP